MKNNIITLFCCFLILIGTSCSQFDEINTNPDVSTGGNASMLLTGVELSFRPGNGKGFMYPFLFQKEFVWTEGAISDIQYNKLPRVDFAGYPDPARTVVDNTVYATLKNVKKMEDAAIDTKNSVNAYRAVAQFIRCFKFFNLTMQVGDIPYSEALHGESGVYKPKYDSQKTILKSILSQLDTASVLFTRAINNNEKLSGDFFYSGSPSKWLKMVNSFKLQVLMSLSAKVNDTDLDVVNRFKNIVNNPAQNPIFASNSDNFQITYRDKEGEKKPFYTSGFEVYAITTSFVIDKLKQLQDYRLFYYADPLAGKPEDDFASYAGLDPSAPNGTNLELYALGKASGINKLYYNKEYPQGFPYVILGYADVQFILAEAAVRGWITNADQYYKNGITASMEFRMNNIDSKWVHGMPITNDYIASYLTKPEIQLPSDKDGMIKQIMWQKYLGSFLQNDWNVYFDYRRNGYPEFPINPATNKNEIADKMPLRWLYPDSEYNYNQENIQQALTNQFGGKDDENQTIWILKN